jgi:hypothetical protein
MALQVILLQDVTQYAMPFAEGGMTQVVPQVLALTAQSRGLLVFQVAVQLGYRCSGLLLEI